MLHRLLLVLLQVLRVLLLRLLDALDEVQMTVARFGPTGRKFPSAAGPSPIVSHRGLLLRLLVVLLLLVHDFGPIWRLEPTLFHDNLPTRRR